MRSLRALALLALATTLLGNKPLYHTLGAQRAAATAGTSVVADTFPVPDPVMNLTDSTDPPAGGPVTSGPPLRVLFMGNSLMYIGDLPAQFRSFAAAGLHRRIVTRMITRPGARLPDLWDEGRGVAAQVLRARPWDVVVLQGFPEESDAGGLAAVVQAIRSQAQRARVLLYVPAQGPEEQEIDAVLDSLNTRIGRAQGLTVVHEGAVLDRFMSEHPTLDSALMLPDRSHQSVLGAYFQALVLYTTLTQQSPVGLPHPVLPGLTDSLATQFQRSATAAVLPHASVSPTLVSHVLPHPPVVVELYTDRRCAACATAEAAVTALAHRAFPQATVVPLVWPVDVAGLPTPAGTRARLAAALAAQRRAIAASTAPLDTTTLALPTLVVDGVPTPVGTLAQAVARAAQLPHPWVTATTLNGSNLAVLLDPVPTAPVADSVDVWAVVTEEQRGTTDRAAPPLAVVRAAQRLQTVSVQKGMIEMYKSPALPPQVVKERTHVLVLVQTHGTGCIVGAAEIPRMVYRGDRPK